MILGNFASQSHYSMDKNQLINICRQIPELADTTDITPLKGGLTNINYRVDTPTDRFMMRVSDKTSPLLGINRDDEKWNNEKAHQAGVAPNVVHRLKEENILIINWIEGRTLSQEAFQAEPDLLPRLAASMKQLHQSAPFQGDFSFPTMRKSYLKTILENNYFVPESYLDAEPLLLELEHSLAKQPEALVSCHNDLCAANFMDDGTHIWIIDYEYASLNEPSFDIGNFAAVMNLNDAQLTTFCRLYWGEHLPEKIKRAKVCSIITQATWVLWSCLQDAVSTIDYGFRDWAILRWAATLPDVHHT
jgi:thiamine kinase-like enzyme